MCYNLGLLLFSSLDSLATRLETERNGALSLNASLCYVCSGNVEKLVENWIKNTEDSTQPLALQVSHLEKDSVFYLIITSEDPIENHAL